MRDLFDQLSKNTNLMISDFRDERNSVRIIEGMKMLEYSGYEMAEWNKLVQYIYDQETSHFQTVNDIIKFVKER